jgi:hypothetical protein
VSRKSVTILGAIQARAMPERSNTAVDAAIQALGTLNEPKLLPSSYQRVGAARLLLGLTPPG